MDYEMDMKLFFGIIVAFILLVGLFVIIFYNYIVTDDRTNRTDPDPLDGNDIVDSIPKEKHEPTYPDDKFPKGDIHP